MSMSLTIYPLLKSANTLQFLINIDLKTYAKFYGNPSKTLRERTF